MVTDIMVTPNTVTFMIDTTRCEQVPLTPAERMLLNEYLITECDNVDPRRNTWHVRPLFYRFSGFYATRIESSKSSLTPHLPVTSGLSPN